MDSICNSLNMIKLILFFFLGVNSSFAFLNIESLRQERSSEHKLTGSTGIRLNDQKGNVDKTQIQFNTLNMMTNGRSNFIFLASYRYGKSFSQEDTRQGDLHFRYTRKLTEKTFMEVFQQTEFNKFENLTLRVLAGGGLRLQVFNNDDASLFSGLGAFYEKEDLTGKEDPENPRGNMYLSYTYKKQTYNINSTLYYQPNLEDTSDGRLRFNAGIETKFLESFSQVLEYTIRRDSRPPIGIKKTDSRLSAGLNYLY